MQLEIEMKAWVHNPRQLESRLDQLGYHHERNYRKEDRYLRSAGKLDVRIRLDDAAAVVTFKDKQLEAGLEINTEHEFTVSDPEIMLTLLHRLGCTDYVQKVKIGGAWRKDFLLLELSEILGLGHFLEIERVVDLSQEIGASEKQQLIAETQQLIVAAFAELGIANTDIEEKTYTSMLLALKSDQ